MAKAAKKASAKRGGAAKTRARSGGAHRSAAKNTGAKKQMRSRKAQGQSSGLSENWLGAASTLVASAVGREILAEVLEAAVSALRRSRGNIGEAARAGAEQASHTAGAAVDVATEVATGTMTLAQTAAGVLAEVATDAARTMLPGSSADDDEEPARSAGRGGRGGRAKE